jgi:hypothetical protein
MSLNVINYGLIVALRNENCHQLGFTFPQQKLTFGVFVEKMLNICRKAIKASSLLDVFRRLDC